jgi:pimeloyl-ACP methyl ester carboxylesterase
MAPTVEALARRFRVLTFTLAGEPTSSHRFDPDLGFDNFVVQIDRVLEEARTGPAVVCGVSYGGLISLRYAALRPERVRALALVSVPPPDYEPDGRTRRYLRSPRLMAPVFCAGAMARGFREMRSALPGWPQRLVWAAKGLVRVAGAPMAPTCMRRRIELLRSVDLVEATRRCQAPALVVTGEPALDRVVPVDGTLRYRELLRNVRVTRLERTGHLGVVLRPDEFASRIAAFAAETEAERADVRRRAV